MEIENTGSANIVQGNEIGTDSTGMIGVGNTQVGVWLHNGATGNTIGGTTTGGRQPHQRQQRLRHPGRWLHDHRQRDREQLRRHPGRRQRQLLNTGGALELTNGAAVLASGSFTGNVLNQGSLSTANGPTILTITGNYTQSNAGILNLSMGGTTAGTRLRSTRTSAAPPRGRHAQPSP